MGQPQRAPTGKTCTEEEGKERAAAAQGKRKRDAEKISQGSEIVMPRSRTMREKQARGKKYRAQTLTRGWSEKQMGERERERERRSD